MMTEDVKSIKSNTIYTVSGEKGRAFLAVSGEASTNRKVLAEVDRIRRGGADFATAKWTARQLARTY
jgi:hypothetical protein